MNEGQIPPPNPADEEDGLIFACTLDGKGSAETVDWDYVEKWTPEGPPLWLHVNGASPRVREWISAGGGLTEPTAGVMLSPESRPRVFRGAKGYVAVLRGINLNPGSDTEDMVSLRMWSDGHRLITVREEKLKSVREVFEFLTVERDGPGTIPELCLRLAEQLTAKIGAVVLDYDDQLDAIESEMDDGDSVELRRRLGDLRQEIVGVRRHLAPQREALNQLMADPPDWLGQQQVLMLRELTDRSQRHIEEIDAARERAVVLKDDIANRLSETMNRNMYVLSIIAGIFLPLSFMTGLLGINVGGMPGVDSADAFWITCGIMVALLGVELYLFRRLGWL
ncbi:MAG: zinc transporter ZntB [Sphingomonadaceae bacterium]|nr:zinc transporter ZntB [Sphingomonadaceae bacterium]